MNKWNHYICPKCGQTTIARHDQEGVTPFLIQCHATKDCQELARSTFFRGSQADDQKPHVIFYRPETRTEVLTITKPMPEMERKWWVEHYDNGGALMKAA